jgi:hypothetical protein
LDDWHGFMAICFPTPSVLIGEIEVRILTKITAKIWILPNAHFRFYWRAIAFMAEKLNLGQLEKDILTFLHEE